MRVSPRAADAPDPAAAILQSLPSLLVGTDWQGILDGPTRALIEGRALVPFLERQRWFAARTRTIRSARVDDWTPLRTGAHPAFLALVLVEYFDGPPEHYFVPMALVPREEAEGLLKHAPATVLARITGARKGALIDGFHDDDLCDRIMELIRDGGDVVTKLGGVRGAPVQQHEQTTGSKWLRVAGDQSNSVAFVDDRYVLKLLRRVESGVNAELEMGRFLPAHGFARTPPLLGALEYGAAGAQPATLAVSHVSVYSQGSGWSFTIDELRRYYERVTARAQQRADSAEALATGHPPRHLGAAEARAAAVPPSFAAGEAWYLSSATLLGRRTGELHVALAQGTDPAFAPEPLTGSDLEALADRMRAHAESALALLEERLATLPEPVRAQADAVLGGRLRLMSFFDRVRSLDAPGMRIRVHGDYHLGQLLRTEEDFVILDFEGEPARSLEERRAKQSPLKDVAGMVRSFNYAAYAALFAAATHTPDRLPVLEPWADTWQHWVSDAFLTGYRGVVGESLMTPSPDAFAPLLDAFVLDKAAYELRYELNSRPDWVRIPLTGMLKLLR